MKRTEQNSDGTPSMDGSCCMDCGAPDDYRGDCKIWGEEGEGAVTAKGCQINAKQMSPS